MGFYDIAVQDDIAHPLIQKDAALRFAHLPPNFGEVQLFYHAVWHVFQIWDKIVLHIELS